MKSIIIAALLGTMAAVQIRETPAEQEAADLEKKNQAVIKAESGAEAEESKKAEAAAKANAAAMEAAIQAAMKEKGPKDDKPKKTEEEKKAEELAKVTAEIKARKAINDEILAKAAAAAAAQAAEDEKRMRAKKDELKKVIQDGEREIAVLNENEAAQGRAASKARAGMNDE